MATDASAGRAPFAALPDTGVTADGPAIAAAARRLQAGELVAFPTETVYGLGADAENPDAIARLYAAKGRPAGHPVIVHISPDADAAYWVGTLPTVARDLIQAFWPGPLTLILKRAAHVPGAASGGQDSIGLRCPSHPVAQALLRTFAAGRPNRQGGVAAPSANRFGHVSPTRVSHVASEFPDLVRAGMPVLEGGPSEVGIESTIIDLSRVNQGMGAVLLRPGHISAEQIAGVTGFTPTAADAGAPRASGTLTAHYAPRTPLALLAFADILAVTSTAVGGLEKGVRLAVLSYRAAPAGLAAGVAWQTIAAEPAGYARALYAALRELDGQGFDRLLVHKPPVSEQWAAVNDRIGRAAAAFLAGAAS